VMHPEASLQKKSAHQPQHWRLGWLKIDWTHPAGLTAGFD